MLDLGPILNAHYRLKDQLESLVRTHAHEAAAVVAMEMVAIAEAVLTERSKLSSTGMVTSSGYIKSAGGIGGHAGYAYLVDKGYLNGVCNAVEAIRLCEEAYAQGWEGEWVEQIESIRASEQQVRRIKLMIQRSPELLQSDLLKQNTDFDSATLYYAAIRGEIIRIKKGRSYLLKIPG